MTDNYNPVKLADAASSLPLDKLDNKGTVVVCAITALGAIAGGIVTLTMLYLKGQNPSQPAGE